MMKLGRAAASDLLCRQEYLAQNIPRWSTRKIGQVLALASETSSILASEFTTSCVNMVLMPDFVIFQTSRPSMLQ